MRIWIAGLALLVAACGQADNARDEDENRAAENERGNAGEAIGEAKRSSEPAVAEAPAEAPLAGRWVMDGTVTGRVEGGIFEITDYNVMFYEDGVTDFEGRIEATDGTDTASFRLEGVGGWERSGDRVRMDLTEITVTPEQSGSDYRDAARLLEAAIRSQPSQSGDIIELDQRTLRIRNIATGDVENYTRG